ncbi:hypothetical protein HKX48_004992 [Thoreauomyces humboldtii]|nr:hypothetical protein HKX48_004992 [Thoreauomyces humboldtii]
MSSAFAVPAASSPLDLAQAALQSLGAVAFVVAAGWIYALKGYFPLSMQRDLARLVVQCLAPCLLLVSISHTVSLEEFYLWWPIPVLFCVYTGLAWGSAALISTILGIPRSRSRFIASAAMMGNTNSLPVALIHSLARDPGSRSVMDPYGDADHVARRGIAFVLFYSLFSNILRWTVCYQLLARDPDQVDDASSRDVLPSTHVVDVDAQHRPDMLQPVTKQELFPGDSLCADVPDADQHTFATRMRRRSRIFSSSGDDEPFVERSTSPTESTPLLLSGSTPVQSPVLAPANVLSRAAAAPSPPPPLALQGSVIPQQSRWQHAKDTFKEIMNAPLYAAILALVIGLIPPVKNLFFSPDGNGGALLEEVITDPLYSLGEASVPIIILTLGGQLGSMKKSREGSPPSPATEALDVGIVVLIKMVILPAVALPLIWAISDHVPLAADRTFAMAMLLLASCPTALNVMNMAQARQNHEGITARLLFWSYLLCIPILTSWVVVSLMMLEKLWPTS